MSDPIKVTDNVFLIGSDDISGAGDCCVYAIGISDENICLIDAGTQNVQALMENLKKTPLGNRNVSDLILTHCHYDHTGGAHMLLKLFPKMRIHAHNWDVAAIQGAPNTENLTAASWYGEKYIPVKVTHVFQKDREVLTLGKVKLILLHTPGHTPGSLSVFYEENGTSKILFGQDVHGPFLPEFNSNIRDWANSMKMLLALNSDILCEGHFGVIRGSIAVKKFITGYIQRNQNT